MIVTVYYVKHIMKQGIRELQVEEKDLETLGYEGREWFRDVLAAKRAAEKDRRKYIRMLKVRVMNAQHKVIVVRKVEKVT